MTYVPYSPMVIARHLLLKAQAEGHALTPLKIIKLGYIAHGWYMAYLENPLINEEVQAWRYGPVIVSLYHSFKLFGSQNIREDNAFYPAHGRVSTADLNDDTKLLLDSVWDAYKGFSALQLSTMTHQQGTPWFQVWHEQGGRGSFATIISNDLIREHYKELIAKRTRRD